MLAKTKCKYVKQLEQIQNAILYRIDRTFKPYS